MFNSKYDIIIVGGGHAGAEAAAAAANMGSKALLITMNLQTIGQMSCNPAMGGIAKGQIVREIDALGGYSGIVSDKTAIQFKMLNKSKGPAMWSPRVQSDRAMFSSFWREKLEQTPNLDFYQEMVTGLIVKNNKVKGVVTSRGNKISSKAVVLTNGTFLNGLIHVGEKNFGGGRAGEKASVGLTSNLESLGFVSGRMKTGTPPRVDGRTLNYELMEEQPGDSSPSKFSYLENKFKDELGVKSQPTKKQLCKDRFAPIREETIASDGIKYQVLPKLLNDCNIYVPKNKKSIEIKNDIVDYIRKNKNVLESGINFILARYLEGINASPNIATKLQEKIPRKRLDTGFSEIIELQDGKCFFCNGKFDDYAQEHFLPWNFIFRTENFNITAACKICNSKKNDRLPHEKYLEKIIT